MRCFAESGLTWLGRDEAVRGSRVFSSPSLEEARAAGALRLSTDFSTKGLGMERRHERKNERNKKKKRGGGQLTDTSETLGQSSPQLFHFADFLRGLRGWQEVAHILFFVRLHCDFCGAPLAAGGSRLAAGLRVASGDKEER